MEKRFRKGDWTTSYCATCEIRDMDDEVVCTVSTDDVEYVMGVMEDYERLKDRIDYHMTEHFRLEDGEINRYNYNGVFMENFMLDKDFDKEKIVDLLNKQENTINAHHSGNLLIKASMDRLKKENEQLKSEINILKVTIDRNEAYIKRLTETSEWHC